MKSFTSLLTVAFVAFAVAPCLHAQSGSADNAAIESKLKQMEDDWEKRSWTRIMARPRSSR